MSTASISYVAFLILLTSTPLWLVARSSDLDEVNPPIKVTRIFSSNGALDLEKNVTGAVSSSSYGQASRRGFAYPFTPKGINFYGGPVLAKGTHVYLIWYGSWSAASKTLIRDFVKQLSPSKPIKSGSVSGWWTLNGLYYGSNGKYISNAISLSGEADDNYSAGRGPLSQTNVRNIVKSAISKKRWAFDNAGQYYVLTSANVKVSGFCSDYCGWHSYYSVGTRVTKYGLVGHTGQCPRSCSVSAPNGNNYLDGTISVLAHELTEGSTDPEFDGWLDYYGYENADKCAWKFGKTYKTSTGQKYNLVGANGKKYLVQQNWNPKRGACALYK